MSNTWLCHGIVHEKPHLPPLGEYNGEDVYHPNQPGHGQIDEALVQFSGKHILVVCFDPTGCQSPEEVAEEVKRSVLWSYECRGKENGTEPAVSLSQRGTDLVESLIKPIPPALRPKRP